MIEPATAVKPKINLLKLIVGGLPGTLFSIFAVIGFQKLIPTQIFGFLQTRFVLL